MVLIEEVMRGAVVPQVRADDIEARVEQRLRERQHVERRRAAPPPLDQDDRPGAVTHGDTRGAGMKALEGDAVSAIQQVLDARLDQRGGPALHELAPRREG